MKKLLLSLSFFTSLAVGAQINNYSLEFYGTNDVVNVPDNGSLNAGTSDFTICFWIKYNSSSINNPEYILGKRYFSLGGGYSVYVRNDGLIRAEINDTDSGTDEINVTTSILDNEWHFFTAVYDRDGNCDVYMDGIKENSVSIATENSDIDNPNPFFIGYFEPGNDRYFDGALDDVHIWDLALDSIAINQYMTCPPVGSEPNLLGYWNFEEGTGTMAGDLTANNNDGTLMNGPVWSTDVPPYNCGVGIDETASTSLIKIYPNPSNSDITIQSNKISSGQISIVNIIGAEVYSASFLTNSIDIDLTQIGSKGTYFVKVLDNKGNIISVEKLIYQ